MTQELFNQFLMNSPIFGVLIWEVRCLLNLSERLARLEGVIYGKSGNKRKN